MDFILYIIENEFEEKLFICKNNKKDIFLASKALKKEIQL